MSLLLLLQLDTLIKNWQKNKQLSLESNLTQQTSTKTEFLQKMNLKLFLKVLEVELMFNNY